MHDILRPNRMKWSECNVFRLQWAENNLWGESRSFAHSFIPSFEHAPYNHRIVNYNGQSDFCLPRYVHLELFFFKFPQKRYCNT